MNGKGTGRIANRTNTDHCLKKHIQALEQKATSLEVLKIDRTGPALVDADLEVLTSRNTQLREVLLHSALKVSDKGLIYVIKNCPTIAIIRITGNERDTVSGKFSGFINGPDIVKSRTNLQALCLEN